MVSEPSAMSELSAACPLAALAEAERDRGPGCKRADPWLPKVSADGRRTSAGRNNAEWRITQRGRLRHCCCRLCKPTDTYLNRLELGATRQPDHQP